MNHELRKLDVVRLLVSEQLKQANRNSVIHGLFESDVTETLHKLKGLRKKGVLISFASYVMYCLVQGLKEHPDLLNVKVSSRKSAQFKKVNLFFIVERAMKGAISVPVGVSLRGAEDQSLEDLNAFVRKMQKADIMSIPGVEARRKLLSYPIFFSKWLIRRTQKKALLYDRYFGNVAVTSLNFFTDKRAWHGIPVTGAPITLLPAGMYKKVVLENGKPIEKDYCCFTLSVNHDMIDGMPASRLAKTFIDKLENGVGLD